jgi:serine/threonine-protein kinase
VLPFTGINQPIRVAVDSSGNVYVVDGGNHRVLKLGAD